MVFFILSENYEFAAMKASGISLQRSMKSLIFFTFLLGIVTFFFSNNIAPIAEYNFHNLRKNISKVKPSMAIAEGQFSQIGDYNIKVENKYGNEGKLLDKVIIHQKKNKPGNYTVIKSKTGEIISEENSDILQLKLYDGNYYDEIISEDYSKKIKKPFVKSYFEEYLINIDIASINEVDFNEEDDVNKHSMMKVNELSAAIDSLTEKRTEDMAVISSKMFNRSNFKTIDYNLNPKEKVNYENDNFLNLFQPKKQKQLYDLAISSVKSTVSIVKSNKTILDTLGFSKPGSFLLPVILGSQPPPLISLPISSITKTSIWSKHILPINFFAIVCKLASLSNNWSDGIASIIAVWSYASSTRPTPNKKLIFSNKCFAAFGSAVPKLLIG